MIEGFWSNTTKNLSNNLINNTSSPFNSIGFPKGLNDEDMATSVTPISPAILPLGTIARAHICQLNYLVLLLLGNVSSIHANMMWPNLDTFVLLGIEGPSMDKKDEHWSIVKHGDEGACEENKNGGSSGDFRTSKPP